MGQERELWFHLRVHLAALDDDLTRLANRLSDILVRARAVNYLELGRRGEQDGGSGLGDEDVRRDSPVLFHRREISVFLERDH